MTEDKSFEKAMSVFIILGILFGLCALFVFANGIPNFSSTEKYAKFCWEEGGYFIERTRETYNTDLCMFDYMYDEGNGIWSEYAMDEKEDGSLCFICWDSGSCARDTLTKIDNGTRRATRC